MGITELDNCKTLKDFTDAIYRAFRPDSALHVTSLHIAPQHNIHFNVEQFTGTASHSKAQVQTAQHISIDLSQF